MSFRTKIKYFLVHTLNYTGKNANNIIASGSLSINGKIIVQNEALLDEDEVMLNGKVIKQNPEYRYFAIHKPIGIESTFHTSVKNNLSEIFKESGSFIVAGRLDKASEGLILVSNNGKWVNRISRPENKKEKEYEVEVDKEIDDEFMNLIGAGVNIGFYTTLPCIVRKKEHNSFSIILTEGKNKQIRRMCKKLGYKVVRLKRIRIDKFYLDDLQGVVVKELKI